MHEERNLPAGLRLFKASVVFGCLGIWSTNLPCVWRGFVVQSITHQLHPNSCVILVAASRTVGKKGKEAYLCYNGTQATTRMCSSKTNKGFKCTSCDGQGPNVSLGGCRVSTEGLLYLARKRRTLLRRFEYSLARYSAASLDNSGATRFLA